MDIQNNAIVIDADTEALDSQITQISNDFAETYYLDNEQQEELEMLVAKAMKLGELYERQKWQAKTQVVPEGFVLVKKVHPDAIVHNQGLGLFKECQVIYGWDSKSKDFKDALNKGFYHGVRLGAKAVLETAMIKAREPSND